MGDDITIGVTEIVNNIEVTAQPNDQVVDISVIDNADDVTLNITPTIIEINVNRGSSFAKWGDILGTLSDQTDLVNALNLKANLVGGKVPASELPSYVDDVVEVANYAALPATGETGKIYVTLDNNKIYRWSGSVYIEIAANSAIWGAITGTLSSQTDLQNALNLKANDSNVVHLTGNETINGFKQFVGSVSFSGTSTFIDSTTGLKLKQSGLSNYNQIQAIDGGFQFFENVGTSFYFNIQQSSIAFGLNTKKVTFNNSNLTSDRTYDLPNAGGTIALTYQLHDAVTIGTANGLSLSGQALSLALASTSTTGALSSTDWNTFNGKQNALTNPITGTGTTNYLPKFTGSTALGNSQIYDNGGKIGIGTTTTPYKFNVYDTSDGVVGHFSGGVSNYTLISFKSNEANVYSTSLGSYNSGMLFRTGATDRMYITSGGNVGIGTTSPSSKLQVVGLPEYATNALALAGGLTVGAFYHTAGILKVVI